MTRTAEEIAREIAFKLWPDGGATANSLFMQTTVPIIAEALAAERTRPEEETATYRAESQRYVLWSQNERAHLASAAADMRERAARVAESLFSRSLGGKWNAGQDIAAAIRAIPLPCAASRPPSAAAERAGSRPASPALGPCSSR